jgi:hypothetical protein
MVAQLENITTAASASGSLPIENFMQTGTA